MTGDLRGLQPPKNGLQDSKPRYRGVAIFRQFRAYGFSNALSTAHLYCYNSARLDYQSLFWKGALSGRNVEIAAEIEPKARWAQL